MSICIFEDKAIRTLFPLVHCQPAFELRCGTHTPLERIQKLYPRENIYVWVRDYLKEIVIENYPNLAVNEPPEESCLFVNARSLFNSAAFEAFNKSIEMSIAFYVGDKIAALKTDHKYTSTIWKQISSGEFVKPTNDFIQRSIPGRMLSYPWNLIRENEQTLREDAQLFYVMNGAVAQKRFVHVIFQHPENIFIGEGCTIQPGVVLNATDGPIIIDDAVTIMSNAVIVGPAYIGKKSVIKIGARIYQNTSIGQVCKVGGEVEDSILHSYANKQHDGFLGHSYLASWTNLGADSNTSDLKNTYGLIRMTLEGEEYNTEEMFLGLIMADHSKCGINTMFNTGTSVGVGCNIFGSNYPPKYIPSFLWGGSESLVEYEFEKFIQVARRVMTRRGIACSNAVENMLKHVFNHTANQRG